MSDKLWSTPTRGDSWAPSTPASEQREWSKNNLRGVAAADIEIDSSQLTLFAEAFPVNRTRSLADDWVPPTNATSGPSVLDCFASLGPDGRFLKTYPDCSPQMLDGSSEAFSETWPRAGMTRSGIAYQRVPSAPLTREIASGWLPTPTASDGTTGQVLNDSTEIRWLPSGNPRKISNQGVDGSVGLARHVLLTQWPTPSAQQQSGGTTGLNGGSGARAKLRALVGREESLLMAGGQLNPTWVEWLMGYPLGWTVCEAWATASSRRSRNGSPSASSRRKG
jgi:DNA (cytosine-5)-methyltransferase 1